MRNRKKSWGYFSDSLRIFNQSSSIFYPFSPILINILLKHTEIVLSITVIKTNEDKTVTKLTKFPPSLIGFLFTFLSV